MTPASGASTAEAGHQGLPSGSSALGFKDSAGAEATAKAAPCLDAHLHGSLPYAAIFDPSLPYLSPGLLLTKHSNNHESFNSLTVHTESYSRGSEPTYEPLQRFLDETPDEQPWSALVYFAKKSREGYS
jgi:hypothetical protein